MTDAVGGLWDDIEEAIHWKPILPLLKRAREAHDDAARLTAIRDVAAFAVRTLTNGDPYTSPAFATFALVVELAQTDPRVLASVTRLMPRE
jgi:hypothetical protein